MVDTFQWPLRVYIEDTDAGGIVYYINYLKYMERARTEYLRSLGFARQRIFGNDAMFVVNAVSSEYLKPAQLDDQLIVTAKIVKLGSANMTLEQLIYRNNELLCHGEVKIVYISRLTMKPKRMPKALRTILQLQ